MIMVSHGGLSPAAAVKGVTGEVGIEGEIVGSRLAAADSCAAAAQSQAAWLVAEQGHGRRRTGRNRQHGPAPGAPGIRPVTGQVGGGHGAATSATDVPGVTEVAVAAGLCEIPAADSADVDGACAVSNGNGAGPAEATSCRTVRAEIDRDCSARPAKMPP